MPIALDVWTETNSGGNLEGEILTSHKRLLFSLEIDMKVQKWFIASRTPQVRFASKILRNNRIFCTDSGLQTEIEYFCIPFKMLKLYLSIFPPSHIFFSLFCREFWHTVRTIVNLKIQWRIFCQGFFLVFQEL